MSKIDQLEEPLIHPVNESQVDGGSVGTDHVATD